MADKGAESVLSAGQETRATKVDTEHKVTQGLTAETGSKPNHELEAKIREQQEQLVELQRKVEARRQLLGRLREIGEQSKSETVEFYYSQLSKAQDEVGLRDKQLGVQQERIKDLERQVGMLRSQLSEAAQATLKVRGLEEDVELVKSEKEALVREKVQLQEKSNFEIKNLREAQTKLQEQLAKAQKDVEDVEKKLKDSDKTREQLQAKMEDVLKQKEKANVDSKTEASKNERFKEELEMTKILLEAEKKKNKELQNAEEKLNKEKRTLEQANKTLEENNLKVKKEMEKMIDSDKLQRGVLESEIKELRGKVHEQREQINKLDGELLEARKKESIPADETEMDRLRQDNNNLLDELRRNMEELIRLEEFETLPAQLKLKEREISSLQQEIALLEAKLQDKQDELASQESQKNKLESGLVKAGSDQDRLQEQIEKLNKDKKELKEKLSKSELVVKDKEGEIQKTLASLEEVKAQLKKVKTVLEKSTKEKDEIARKLDRVLSDMNLLKKTKDELQVVFDKMQQEFSGLRESLGKKDEWILKQGSEMKTLAEQYNNLKKKHGEFRQETEIGSFLSDAEFGKILSDKNTEIMVLREMIKSTKSMVRAKEVDLVRLKRRVDGPQMSGAFNSSQLGAVMSDEERMVPPSAGIKSSIGLKVNKYSRLSAPKNQKKGSEQVIEEEYERPVFRLIKGIEEKKQVPLKKSPGDIKKMLDEDDLPKTRLPIQTTAN